MKKIYDIVQKNYCCGLYRGYHYPDCTRYKSPQTIIRLKKLHDNSNRKIDSENGFGRNETKTELQQRNKEVGQN